MGSNEQLSDLDLELLGEKPSPPIITNERPAISPGLGQTLGTKAPTQAAHTAKPSSSPSPDSTKVISTKAPTQAGFTTKSQSSTSPDRVNVFGSTSVQAGFTIKAEHLPSVYGPAVTPKIPQTFTTQDTPLPSDHHPTFTTRLFGDRTTETTSSPSEHSAIFAPLELKKSTMSAQTMTDKTDAIKTEAEYTNESDASITTKDVMDLPRKSQRWENLAKDQGEKLTNANAENTTLKNKHSKVENQLRVELKETNKKLSSTESENAELVSKNAKTEEALRLKVQQGVRDWEHAKAAEQTFENIKTQYETLKKTHTALEHKSKTQTNQVVGCEKKVTKTLKQLADYKDAAEAKVDLLEDANAKLKRALASSMETIRSNGIEERRAEIDGFSAHVDGFEESRKRWGEERQELEDELTSVKTKLDVKERSLVSVEEENKKLTQAKKDLKKANQDLRNQQNTQTGYTTKEAQVASNDKTQINYTTDEDQSSSEKKPQRSLGAQFHDFGIHSSNDESSEEEERTVTMRNSKPPPTDQGWTRTEEKKTLTIRKDKPITTSEDGTPTQAPKLDRSLIISIESAPVNPGSTPLKATHSQAVQTEPETINLQEKKPWYLRNHIPAIFSTVMVSALFMLLAWAWYQGQAAMKERKMWMQANDHAYRSSDEVIRKQAIALLQRTQDRARLGWLTPEKVMTLHRGAHKALARTFLPLVQPTRTSSTASLVQSAMAPTAIAKPGVWQAWSDAL
jgi:chromosome segregation ATPase